MSGKNSRHPEAGEGTPRGDTAQDVVPARSARVLDDREARWVRIGAAAGALALVAVWTPALDERAGVLLIAIGLAMAGVLAWGGRRRSRLLSGIGALLLGFGPWGFAWPLGIPYLVLAAKLATGGARAVTAAAVADLDAGDAPSEESTTGPVERPRRSAKSKATPSPTTRGRPGASRRYTPPTRRA